MAKSLDELTPARRLLKVFAVAAIVVGAVIVACGMLIVLAAWLTSQDAEGLEGVTQNLTSMGMEGVTGQDVVRTVSSIGATFFVTGALLVAVGVSGVYGANHPYSATPAVVLGLVGLAVAGVMLVSELFSGNLSGPAGDWTLAVSYAVAVAFMACFCWVANRVRRDG